MKIVPVKEFLTKRRATFEPGFIAAGIHPESEVDLVRIDGALITVGSLAPISPIQGCVAEAVRAALPRFGYTDDAQHHAHDGVHIIGEELVLALYEKCDALVPPGPRAPRYQSVNVTDEDLPILEADAQLITRVPMQGRSTCAIAFGRETSSLDMTIVVFGRRGNALIGVAESAWFDPDADPDPAPPLFINGDALARGVYVQNERYDELLIYAYGDEGDAASNTIAWSVDGEGVNQ